MDMVTRVPRFLVPGETLTGLSFGIFPGGKGANQAVALARLGARVEMVGAIGDDVLGARYASILETEGVGRTMLRVRRGTSTGTASIEVADSGENHIAIVPGANASVDTSFIEEARPLIESSDVVLLQLEIPLDSVVLAASIARAAGRTVILDPAPARELPPELYPLLSYITPNETEASILTGEECADEASILRAARILLEKGTGAVIVKAGKRGAYIADAHGCISVQGFAVDAIDTVAAGDSFNAGLAFALADARGKDLCSEVRFANAVAALSTTKEGAQAAMPGLDDVRRFLAALGVTIDITSFLV
jgi:ribokinase